MKPKYFVKWCKHCATRVVDDYENDVCDACMREVVRDALYLAVVSVACILGIALAYWVQK